MQARDAWGDVDPRDRALIVRLVLPLAQRYQAALRLFGSRARGDARRTSDIDLALCAPVPLPADELAALREVLDNANVPFRIDLVDYARAAPVLRQAIDREGIAWID